MLDHQLSWAGLCSLLNYAGLQSVTINCLHSTFGAHCEAEKKKWLFLCKACSLTSEEPQTGQGFRREEAEELWGRWQRRLSGRGWVLVAVAKDKSWGCWGDWKIRREEPIKKEKKENRRGFLLGYMGSNVLLLWIMPSFSSFVWWVWNFKTSMKLRA